MDDVEGGRQLGQPGPEHGVKAGVAVQPSARVVVKVSPEPITLAECDTIAAPSDGALVTFSGIVRNETEGRPVSSLMYESYKEMAEIQMADIGQMAAARFGLSSVLLVHRTGNLGVGEVSVLAAVSAPHRGPAFEACRFCIDAIKQKVAIWKKELFSDGGSRWVDHP